MVLGLDVGKSAHHGHGLTPAGKKVCDKQLPNSEPKLRAVFDKLAAKFGTVLVNRGPARLHRRPERDQHPRNRQRRIDEQHRGPPKDVRDHRYADV